MTTWLQCDACSTRFDLLEPIARCRQCRGLLALASDLGPTDLARRFADQGSCSPALRRSGVWRFRDLILPEARDADVVSFPEGNTPQVQRARVAEWAGCRRLWLKHEGMNPTGSFKDRGMTVAVTHARRLGARAVACASTGNTSASLAAYAAHAGLLGVVLIPAGKTALGKLAQTVAYGATVLAIRGDFDACLDLVDQASERLGLYLVNSINPLRLAGQKSIVFELLEDRAWRAPDWIALPAGNLGNTSAFGAALQQAHALGLIDRIPRLAAVQAEGAAPFARSYREQFAQRYRVEADTVATAIRIGNPASHDRAVAAVRGTNGVVTMVSDQDILAAKREIDQAGVGCEPASAASVAGVRRLVREGTIGPDEDVVAVLTGHILKDPEILLRDRGDVVREIDPTLAAVEAAIASAGQR
ncbi:MAG: threonine synthase [Gemmatimonadetes bacterium]|nr:threonine synthase [Gemmatimonadota bacterium]